MSIPRRYIWVAAGAVFAAGAMAWRNRAEERERQDRAKNKRRRHSREESSGQSGESPQPQRRAAGHSKPAPAKKGGPELELASFLAGDTWLDESGWKSLWEREAISSPSDWIRDRGKKVLKEQCHLLSAQPALLAGCRRRFIVVSRYAEIDVSDAAKIWSDVNVSM